MNSDATPLRSSPSPATRTVTPVFIFSLPRSGSTLLQRLLAARDGVATASEPWLLLPLFYATRTKGIYTEYEQRLSVGALTDFFGQLEGGRSTYTAGLRDLALNLYASASPPGTTHFIDKTPRYHLIVDDILDAFPDARFIFLWRSPLSIISSMMSTWAHGRWNLHYYKVDLFQGLENLARCYAAKRGPSLHALRYEDLIDDPVRVMEGVFDYLDLPFDPGVIDRFTKVRLEGEKGDKIGTRKYAQLSSDSLERWRSVLANPLRKRWARRYLEWIGDERLQLMGYDLDELRRGLLSTPVSSEHLVSDCLDQAHGFARSVLEPRIFLDKIPHLRAWHKVNPVR